MSYELLPKEILYNNDALDKLEQGVKAVHDAVGVTMGPSGSLVMFEEDQKIPYPTVTKDGVSVASMIAFEDQAMDNGAQFVIQAARKQVHETGDGTTLTSILTYKIFKEGRKLITTGFSPNEVIADIKFTVSDAVEHINNISVKDVDFEALKKIARVSTNNDHDLADKIAEAVDKTGKHGLVFQKRSQSDEHEVEYVDGYSLDIGILAKEFANTEDEIMIIRDPYILVTDKDIYNASELMPILRKIKKVSGDKPPGIVIFAPNISGDVLQVMKKNIVDPDGQFFMVHIRPSKDLRPEKNKMVLEDLAAITDSMFISQDSGFQIDKLELSQLGTCNSISSYPEKTMITGFASEDRTAMRIKELESKLELTTDEYTKESMNESLAKITGGVATIKVGGRNLSEQSEILYRVDDAVRACKSAQEMGYVRGGGVAMMEAHRKLNRAGDNSSKVILEALKYPAEVILKNSKRDDWQGIITSILVNTNNNGYNIINGSITDMYKLNIIDPTKVIVYALKNAASAAISMLQTSVMIIAKRPNEGK